VFIKGLLEESRLGEDAKESEIGCGVYAAKTLVLMIIF
jgi:hypothetical protein